MDGHALPIPYFREVVVFLIAAGLAVPVMHRLRISPVLGYLFIGAGRAEPGWGTSLGSRRQRDCRCCDPSVGSINPVLVWRRRREKCLAPRVTSPWKEAS